MVQQSGLSCSGESRGRSSATAATIQARKLDLRTSGLEEVSSRSNHTELIDPLTSVRGFFSSDPLLLLWDKSQYRYTKVLKCDYLRNGSAARDNHPHPAYPLPSCTHCQAVGFTPELVRSQICPKRAIIKEVGSFIYLGTFGNSMSVQPSFGCLVYMHYETASLHTQVIFYFCLLSCAGQGLL